MTSRARIQLEDWLKTIDVFGNVIDIGGSQNPVKGRTKSWNVKEYKIMDLEIPHEIKRKPDIIGDIQAVPTPECDIAFSLEVAEYWFNPLQALQNIKANHLYISFHWLYGLHNPEGTDFLRYSKYGIEKLLTAAGFKIIEMIPRELSSEGRNLYFRFCQTEKMRLNYQNKEMYREGYLVYANSKT